MENFQFGQEIQAKQSHMEYMNIMQAGLEVETETNCQMNEFSFLCCLF